jgi:hypothetical protein
MHPSKSNRCRFTLLFRNRTAHDLAELYIIDQVSGKISKAISGDALPFLNAHSIIGERFFKLTFSLKQT